LLYLSSFDKKHDFQEGHVRHTCLVPQITDSKWKLLQLRTNLETDMLTNEKTAFLPHTHFTLIN